MGRRFGWSAEIPGYGPVLADVARQIVDEASDSEWRIIPVDETGHPVGVITTRRRPTAAQKRIVETRNPTCVFPGCRMPADECDLNHEIPWAERIERRPASSDLSVDMITSTITVTDGN